MIYAYILNSWHHISEKQQRFRRKKSLLSIQIEYAECEEHEKENVRISYPVINGNSMCPLCEARQRARRLEAQYERAMIAAHDLAGLILGKDKR